MKYELINPHSSSPLLLTVEHASNRWPDEMDPPDFPLGWENNHIAYDLGTAPLARAMAEKLGCGAILGSYSRLLVDLNRLEADPNLIVGVSDGVPLASNKHISAREKEHRIDAYYRPYHEQIAQLLDQKGKDALMISLHSFTPKLQTSDVQRPWEIGILAFDHDPLSTFFLDHLRRDKSLYVGDNQPYDLRQGPAGSVDQHAAPRKILCAEIEIRNDEFAEMKAGVDRWCSTLCFILEEFLKSRG